MEITNLLFLDIETASAAATFADLSDDFKALWKKKAAQISRTPADELDDEQLAELYTGRAAIFSEFGQIICISVGAMYRDKDKQLALRLKSFAGTDEKKLLEDFAQMVNQYYNDPRRQGFCGHNIKEFDMPYICRRMLVHQIPLPNSMQVAGKKPWELNHFVDTLELWKFGDRKNYTSLAVLTTLLGIPSPKDDIDGSQVGRVFWEENDVERIATYCEKDVLATTQLYLRMHYLPLLPEERVTDVDR